MKTIFKKNGGFTLVELIVVIAILAILAAVAIPAYSGYIDKTNQQVDLTLISDIERALVLNYYSDISSFEGGSIVSVAFDAPAEAYDDFAENAMKATFGETWRETTKLVYDGWMSNKMEIDGNYFQGKETAMLNRVDKLTSSLIEPINAFAGDNFQAYMNANGIDSTDKKTVSNAAVMYVANNTAKLSDAKQQEVINVLQGAYTSGGVQNMMKDIQAVFDGDLVSAAAVMYAVGAAYSEKTGIAFEPAFRADMTPEQAGAAVNNAFVQLAVQGGDGAKSYLEGNQVAKDVKAYVDILSTVDTAKSQVLGNLGSLGTGTFTWASAYGDLFTNYNNGGIIVFLELDENGAPVAGTTLVED